MTYEPLRIGNLVSKVPIVQGGMGIGISLGNLAGAVAKEGCVGIISAAQIGFREPGFRENPFQHNLHAIGTEYEKARSIAPEGIIGFNIMVAMKHYAEYVKEAVSVGANLIISGAGLPTELPSLVEGSKTKIAPIVSTKKSANVILKYWDRKYKRTADMVVIEGPKAGGHLGFQVEQLEAFDDETYQKEILEIKNTIREYEEKYNCRIPVVVAGGIATANDMQDIMNLGVQGVQIATKFVTTEECDAHETYKQSYINARKDDIQIVKSPVGMPGRAIMNPFMKRIMSGEKIPPTRCLQCLHKCNPSEIPYCITDALIKAAEGNVEEGLLFCGKEAYTATKIETVKDVVAYYMEK